MQLRGKNRNILYLLSKTSQFNHFHQIEGISNGLYVGSIKLERGTGLGRKKIKKMYLN